MLTFVLLLVVGFVPNTVMERLNPNARGPHVA